MDGATSMYNELTTPWRVMISVCKKRFRQLSCLGVVAAMLAGCRSTPDPFAGAFEEKQKKDSSAAWTGIAQGGQRQQSPAPTATVQRSKAKPPLRSRLARITQVQFEPPVEPERVAPPAPGAVAMPTSPGVGLAAPVMVEEPVASLGNVIVLPYGVGPDQPGLRDNVSARIGGTYHSVDNSSAGGASAILESTKQIGHTDFFAHGGIGTEYIDGEWPMIGSVGFSRLATIFDGQVVKPWILDFTYDLYYDTEFFQTDDAVFLDQFRMLAGYAVTPRLDMGAWAALGLQSDSGWKTVPGGSMRVRTGFSDRIAGYLAADVGALGTHVVLSAGWEEHPGNVFVEGDAFVPLTQNANLFGGVGYSDSGTYDAIVGIELTFNRRGKNCDPCGDVCAPRYRGGWANDNYRGALRTITPSRARRTFKDTNWEFIPDLPAGPVGEPVPDPADDGPVVIDPPIIGGETPIDNCMPRWDFREERESNLSRFLGGLVAGDQL